MAEPVLLTGAGGRIGQILLERLGDDYDWRLLDEEPLPRETIPDSVSPEHVYTGNITDRELVQEAVSDARTVIHLAADPRPEAPWDSVLENNIHGVKVLLEASVNAGVENFAFASSNHAVKYHENGKRPEIYRDKTDPFLDGEELPHPANFYGVSKAAGEMIGRYYHETHDLSFVAVRIGNVTGETPPIDYERGMSMWLSPRDCAHLFERCILADYDFAIVYGISDNDRRYYSLESARQELGYRPMDNSADYADTE